MAGLDAVVMPDFTIHVLGIQYNVVENLKNKSEGHNKDKNKNNRQNSALECVFIDNMNMSIMEAL